MKRTVWLATMAACALFCLTAFAGDVIAAQSSSILPEPPKIVWWAPLLGTLVAASRTYFSDNTVRWPVLLAGWRLALVAGLAAVGTLIEQLTNGASLKTALFTFAMLGVPSIVQEVLKIFGSKASPGAGSVSGAASGTGIRPPAGESMKLAGTVAVHDNGRRYWFKPAAVGVAVGFCALAFIGCAAKPFVCPILKIAADACDSVVIVLPDGSEERVPTAAIVGVAQSARAARLAGTAQPGAVDAGADR